MRRLPLVALALFLLAPAAPAGEPVKYALLVGVNTYKHERLPPLAWAVNDATEMAQVLRGLGYQVTLLTDDTPTKPTKPNIDAALKKVLDGCEKGDTVLIGLSGHGLQFGPKDSYFCPADARPNEDRKDTLIPLSALYTGLEDSFAGVKVLLVDACRNDPRGPAGGRKKGGVNATTAPPPTGVAALFSCSPGEESLEHPELRHGVFFHHVIQGIKGQARNGSGRVTFNSLADYVVDRVEESAQTLQPGHKQSPNQRADLRGTSPVLAGKPAAVAAAPKVMPKPTTATAGGDATVRPPAGGTKAAEADYTLAEDYHNGRNGKPKDPAEALKLYRKAAAAGHAAAMNSVGVYYGKGLAGLAVDDAEAVRWYQKAAAAGESWAMYNVASRYDNGRTLPRDEAEAARWFKKAAEAGVTDAMSYLGDYYSAGKGGLPKDDALAGRWYKPAAEGGNAVAMNNLANLFRYGKGGFPTDVPKAVEWYTKSADGGCAVAMYNLGFVYDAGQGPVTKDQKLAYKWFRKGADAGNPGAMDFMGDYVRFGKGGAGKDDVAAVKWYRQAADAGNMYSMWSLGVMLETGKGGLDKDDAEAAKWYKKAAEAGNFAAMNSYALMLEDGRGGLTKSETEAVRWYRKSADGGNSVAMSNMGLVCELGQGGQPKNPAEAVRWFRKAADKGEGSGMYHLGRYHENGLGGLALSRDKAIEWYKKAVAAGHPKAKDKLAALGAG